MNKPSLHSPLAIFTYLVIGAELFFFFTLGFIDRMLGLLNMTIVTIISALLNIILIAALVLSSNKHRTTPNLLAIFICLWPMLIIAIFVIVSLINALAH